MKRPETRDAPDPELEAAVIEEASRQFFEEREMVVCRECGLPSLARVVILGLCPDCRSIPWL